MESIKRRLNEEYGNDIDRQIVPVPTIGMYCVTNVDDVWYRAKVLNITDAGQFDVFLIDVAQRNSVEWYNLFYLKEEYFSPPECIIQMSLHDIKGDDTAKTAMTAKFLDFYKDSKLFTVKVEQISMQLCYSVTLYAISSELDRICINHALNKIAVASSCSLTSIGSLASTLKPPNTNDPSHNGQPIRRKIIITHSKSPGEFYIILSDLEKRRRNIELEIQANMASGLCGHHFNWKARDRCFVKNGENWCRGVVIEPTESACLVYLCDYGETITAVMPEDLVEPKDYMNAPGMAIKCHLAFLKPTRKDSWSSTATEQFKAYCDQFSELSISIPQLRSTTLSLAVVLWGYSRAEIRALEPAKFTFRNINRDMLYKGLACSTTTDNDVFHAHDCHSFPDHVDISVLIEDIIKNYVADSQRLSKSSQSSSSTGMFKWPIAEPMNERTFRATPVYISRDMRIHVQTLEQAQCCDKMTDTLTKWHQDQTIIPKLTTWKVGEACVAKFVDGMYHRAEVLMVDTMNQKCKVSRMI